MHLIPFDSFQEMGEGVENRETRGEGEKKKRAPHGVRKRTLKMDEQRRSCVTP